MGLWAILLGDRDLSSYDCFSDKMVFKGHALGTVAKPQLCTFIVQVCWESFELWAILLGDRASGLIKVWKHEYDGYAAKAKMTNAVVAERRTQEQEAQQRESRKFPNHRIIAFQDLVYLFAEKLQRDRALSWWYSFSGQMVLKRLCISDTGEVSSMRIHYSGIWEMGLLISMVVWVDRWSWKGNSWVTLGKPWLCTGNVQVSQETRV